MNANYRLSFNQSLRWQDLRSERSNPASRESVYFYYSTYYNNPHPIGVIRNLIPYGELSTKGKILSMQTAMMGYGHLDHEIIIGFNEQVRSPNYKTLTPDNFRLCLGVSEKLQAIMLLSPFMAEQSTCDEYYKLFSWSKIEKVNLVPLALCLVIPLTIVGLK